MNISASLATFAFMYKIVKPLFFSMSPETAHHNVTGGLRRFNKIWGTSSPQSVVYRGG